MGNTQALRVLIHNRDPLAWVGGDAVQVAETIKSLKNLGVDVTFSHNTFKDPREYDLVHAFNVNFFWTVPMQQEAKKHKIPLVLSPIYFDMEYDQTFGQMSKLLYSADRVIALSKNEQDQMIKRYGIKNSLVISNGINDKIFHKNNGVVDKYVLAVGRSSDPAKGAHLVANACRKLNIPLLYVGMSSDNEFSNSVKRMCWKYIENIKQKELAKLYQKAKVYVCSSLSERQSLGVLEAAACGCPIVDSIYNLGANLLPSSRIVDPNNLDALCGAIQEQWEKPRNTDKVPTWNDVAEQILKVYTEVLDERKANS